MAGGVGLGGSGRRFPQAATVAKHRLLDVLGEVVPQVPAVGDLDGSWRAGAGAVGVGAGPVAADHPGAGMLAKPDRERLCLSVFQQVDGPVGGHVYQHGAVDPAAAEREIVHTQHGHLPDLGSGSARSSRSSVSWLAGSPNVEASRAPARPASASATCSSSVRSSGVRRA